MGCCHVECIIQLTYSAVRNYETTSIFDSFPDLECNNIYTQILKADKLHIIEKEIFSGCHLSCYIWNLINIHGDNPIVMLFNPLIPLSLPNEVALFYQNNHLFRCQQLTRSEQKCQLRCFSSADVIIYGVDHQIWYKTLEQAGTLQ